MSKPSPLAWFKESLPVNTLRWDEWKVGFLGLMAWAALGMVLSSTSGQPPTATRFEPRIPGAVEKAPPWLKDAPFDVARFFEMPPAGQNAAPLYLNALSEFGTELDSIFPPEVRKRSPAMAERAKRAAAVYGLWVKDPAKADRVAIDAVLAESKEGFRKLDLAQQRPRCVFAIGLALDSPLPHGQTARAAVRVLMMRTARSLDRDDFDSAIGDLAQSFRMSRDLRPRGPLISQLVSIAIDGVTCSNGIALLLTNRKLKVDHCDRLLKLLAEHEALAIDPFVEGIKADYVMSRYVLCAFAEGIKTNLDTDGRPVETKLNRPGGVEEVVEFFRTIGTEADPAKAASMNLTDPQALKKDQASFDACLKSMLATPPNFKDRERQAKLLEKSHLTGRPNSFFKLLYPDYSMVSLSAARDLVYLRTTCCLVALKRWQLTHTTAPTDLAEVCRSAKLPGVPVDPFSGSTLKMAMISGELVIYSIGNDGVDDRGLKDAELGKKTEGDFLFRRPQRK